MPRIKGYEASEKRFRAIKTLSENGVPKTQIAKILGLASSSVWRMLQHETYDEYLEDERNKHNKKEIQVIANKFLDTISEDDLSDSERMLRRVLENQQYIIEKLENIKAIKWGV